MARTQLRPSTYESYRANLSHHVLPRLGATSLSGLTPLDLAALYGELLTSGRVDEKGGLSPKTVHYVHTILHRVLRDAQRWGLLESNPAELISSPRYARPEISVWGPEEVRRFLYAIREERLYSLYLLAVTTGLRRDELLALSWARVDLVSRCLYVTRSLIALNYKMQVSETKTRRGRRRVALDDHSVAALEEQRGLSPTRGEEASGTELVFTTPEGSPLHPHSVSQGFDRLVRKHGLPRIRFHDLRHTSASLALAAGVHPKVVSERLGHASVTITLDTYSHVLPSLQAEAANKIASLIL